MANHHGKAKGVLSSRWLIVAVTALWALFLAAEIAQAQQAGRRRVHRYYFAMLNAVQRGNAYSAKRFLDEGVGINERARRADYFILEAARLGRQVEKLEGEMARIDTKLARPDFLARAPAHVIEGQRTRRAEAEATRAKLAAALAQLGAG